MQVQRFDLSAGGIRSHRTTPQGGLLARARFARTGIQVYHQPDGSTRREFRPADEVFDRDSLDSFKNAPVTIGHPPRVTPSNWRNVSVGHVPDAPRPVGRFIEGDVAIQHDKAMDDAVDGKVSELSCGYTCDLDETPGKYNGEPYDAVQRNIRINHVALLPKGAGRAGPDVRLHLDELAGHEATEEEIAQAEREQRERVRAFAREMDRVYERNAAARAGGLPVAEVRADAADDVDEIQRVRQAMIVRDSQAWQKKRPAPAHADAGKKAPPDAHEEEETEEGRKTREAYDAMVKRDAEAWTKRRAR